MCSRTVSPSQTITRLKTVFLNAQPLDTPLRVWNMVTSAVCNLLLCPRALTLCLRKHTRHLGCGDVADITNNGGKTAAESDCATACSGDPLHLCGGSWRLQLYLWNGDLNTWHAPKNIGRYEVFAFSVPVCTCAKGHQRSTSCPALYFRWSLLSVSMANSLSSRKESSPAASRSSNTPLAHMSLT